MVNQELNNILKEIKLRNSYYRCGEDHDSRVVDHIYFMAVYHQYCIDMRKKIRHELTDLYQAHNKLMEVI